MFIVQQKIVNGVPQEDYYVIGTCNYTVYFFKEFKNDLEGAKKECDRLNNPMKIEYKQVYP